MTYSETNATYSRELRDMLLLRTEPIAVKMIEDESEVPENAIRPLRDLGKHMALCQAFSYARRDRKTICLEKEDHWCWTPLICLGCVDCSVGTKPFEVVTSVLGIEDRAKSADFFAGFPRLPMDKYRGIVTAPLSNCPFEPDVVLIYTGNGQLRTMVLAIKSKTGTVIKTELDGIDSCIYSVVVPMQTGEYQVTLPDLGEQERAATEEYEIILSVPKGRMDELMDGLRALEKRNGGYKGLRRDMELDFGRPPFYNTLFGLWGLQQGQDWKR